MIFLFNFFIFTFTIMCSAPILGHETQGQICDSNLNSGLSNVHISFGNSESRACNSRKISYLIGSQKVTWFQAYSLCKQSGMELASIFSEDEEIAVENATRTVQYKVGYLEGYWLAGTKHGAFGSDFVWFTTGKPVVYKKFHQGQPDNAAGNEACLEFFSPGRDIFAWNDASCDLKFGFICQSSNCW